ncbi:GntR family transcriptional regulator [Algihabitans albus]|uniref:GntR family transcriptional regulator n=1 Tax=Algihabitans albus TaxID=2164067 RepID=UPI000E5D25B1|nr:GntR family transcriptional regulator [Algihabitans albus]
MKPISTQPQLADQVYTALLDAIGSGQLTPGLPLVQERLAAELNVSRQPVVQALLLLKTQGFVEATGRRGLQVARLNPQAARRVYAVRGALDRLAARAAAQAVAEDNAARQRTDVRLQALIENGRRAIAYGKDVQGTSRQAVGMQKTDVQASMPALIEADIAFHQAIYDLADNPLIAQSAEVHWFHIRRIMGAVLRDHEQRDTVWREHEGIAESILSGDVERAGRLAEAHVEKAAEMLIGRLEDRMALTA